MSLVACHKQDDNCDDEALFQKRLGLHWISVAHKL